MNSSTAQSPLAALMMSLGGSIDLKSLAATPDGDGTGSGFSSLLQDLQTGKAAGSTPLTSMTAMPAASDDESLPHGLPPLLQLSQSIHAETLSTDTQAELVADADLIMDQIERPPALGIRLADPDSESLTGEEALLAEDELLPDTSTGESPEVIAVAPPVMPVSEAVRQAGTPDMAIAGRAGRSQQSGIPGEQRSGMADGAGMADLTSDESFDSELEGDSVFRPVTASDDVLRTMNRETSTSQVTMQSTPVQFAALPTTTAAASVPFAGISAETAQAVGVSDASDGVDLQASETFEQKLHAQLKERIEFGQDRREWGTALGARVMTMVSDNIQQARIQIDPPELGSLEIKLHVTQDQATVQVQAQHHQVKDVLEANVQRLRDALSEQGLQLAGFDVGTSSQQQQSSGGQADGQQSDNNAGEWAGAEDTPDNTGRPAPRSNALLDTFA